MQVKVIGEYFAFSLQSTLVSNSFLLCFPSLSYTFCLKECICFLRFFSLFRGGLLQALI